MGSVVGVAAFYLAPPEGHGPVAVVAGLAAIALTYGAIEALNRVSVASPDGIAARARVERRERDRADAITVVSIFLVVLAALAVSREEWLFVAVAGAGGSIGVVASSIRAAVRWRPAVRVVAVEAVPASVRRGGDVEVVVRFLAPAPADISVALVWREDYDERRLHEAGLLRLEQRVARRDEQRVAGLAVAAGTTEEVRLSATVPAASPYSFAGQCVSYSWAAVVEPLAQPRWPELPHRETPLEVLP